MQHVTDDEVVRMMLDGGLKLCEHALVQWCSGKYTAHLPEPEAHEQKRQQYYRFQAMKARMRDLAKEMKSRPA